MKVTLSTVGRFHIFPLAKELEKKGYLEAIYSGFPWSRLERENVSREYVHTFPWVRTLLMGTRFLPFKLPEAILDGLHVLSVVTLDQYVARTLLQSDIYVGHEAVGLISGAEAQKRGMLYVCDRGCTHMAWRERILNEENERLGLKARRKPMTYEREIAEYHQADLIVVPSQFVADSFVAEGIAKEKLAIVPYGVNLQRFNPVAKPAQDTFEVVFVGRICARKGVKDLLDAFDKVKIANKRLTLVGTIDKEFQKLINKQLQATNIRVLGHVAQTELREVLSRSHVFCLPSIEEGMALVVAEAMACGCPPIITYNTGATSLVNDGKNGFVVPIRNSDAIAEKLELLANNRIYRAEMGQAALASVQALGGWENYGEQMINVYRRLIEKNI